MQLKASKAFYVNNMKLRNSTGGCAMLSSIQTFTQQTSHEKRPLFSNYLLSLLFRFRRFVTRTLGQSVKKTVRGEARKRALSKLSKDEQSSTAFPRYIKIGSLRLPNKSFSPAPVGVQLEETQNPQN